MKKFIQIVIIAAVLLLPPLFLYDWAVSEDIEWLYSICGIIIYIELGALVLGILYGIYIAFFHSWKASKHNVKIKKGKHFDVRYWWTRIWWIFRSKVVFRVKFIKGKTEYYGQDSLKVYFEESWNKLGGVSMGYTHYVSDRIGFRFNGTCMEVCKYQYKKGEKKAIISDYQMVEWDEWVEFECDIKNVLGRKLKWYEKLLLFRNNPMFGGKYKAPSDIEFEYQSI